MGTHFKDENCKAKKSIKHIIGYLKHPNHMKQMVFLLQHLILLQNRLQGMAGC